MVITKEYIEELRKRNITPTEYRDLLIQKLYNLTEANSICVDVVHNIQELGGKYAALEIQSSIGDISFRVLKELYELDNGKSE